MTYDKGPQITVGMLKTYLACIPDDVKVSVGIGSDREPLHYLLNVGGELVLHPDSYMEDARDTNIQTIMSFNVKK